MESYTESYNTKAALGGVEVVAFGFEGLGGIFDAVAAQSHVEEAGADMFTEVGAEAGCPGELSVDFVAVTLHSW